VNKRKVYAYAERVRRRKRSPNDNERRDEVKEQTISAFGTTEQSALTKLNVKWTLVMGTSSVKIF